MYLVYKTDCHHSYASREIIGVATDKDNAVGICCQHAIKNDEIIDTEQLFNLENILQTQNFSGDGEFQIELLPVNKLI